MTGRNRILHADDESVLRNVVRRILTSTLPQFALESFVDGPSLEARINQGLEDVALIITDNKMPGIFGSEIIREYAIKPELKRVPIILTYSGDPEIGKKAVADGAFSCLLKPFSVEAFGEKVADALLYSVSDPTA